MLSPIYAVLENSTMQRFFLCARVFFALSEQEKDTGKSDWETVLILPMYCASVMGTAAVAFGKRGLIGGFLLTTSTYRSCYLDRSGHRFCVGSCP
jgi:ABC-type molybdate transport system permease subunit